MQLKICLLIICRHMSQAAHFSNRYRTYDTTNCQSQNSIIHRLKTYTKATQMIFSILRPVFLFCLNKN